MNKPLSEKQVDIFIGTIPFLKHVNNYAGDTVEYIITETGLYNLIQEVYKKGQEQNESKR